MLNIIGFDPSLRNWGVAAARLDGDQLDVIHMEVICPVITGNKQTRTNSKDVEAALQLYQRAAMLMNGAHVVCIEVPHGSQSARAMASYGICVGVIGALKALGIPVIEVSAMDVKKMLGRKDASKQDIINYVQEKHPEAPLPKHNGKVSVEKANHCCDAVVAIHAAMQTDLFKVLQTASQQTIRKLEHAT